MIDIEIDVFDQVARAVSAVSPDAYVTSRYVLKPPSFPCVVLIETSNLSDERRADSSGIERASRLRWQAQVFSNSEHHGKRECKQIMGTVCDAMNMAGFARVVCRQVDNSADPTITRMVAEFTATVDSALRVYRR